MAKEPSCYKTINKFKITEVKKINWMCCRISIVQFLKIVTTSVMTSTGQPLPNLPLTYPVSTPD